MKSILFIFLFAAFSSNAQHPDSCYYISNVVTPDCDCYDCCVFEFIWGCEPFDDFHVVVYNKWEEVVYESTDPLARWRLEDENGNLIPDGVYLWEMTGKATFDSDGDGLLEYATYTARQPITILR